MRLICKFALSLFFVCLLVGHAAAQGTETPTATATATETPTATATATPHYSVAMAQLPSGEAFTLEYRWTFGEIATVAVVMLLTVLFTLRWTYDALLRLWARPNALTTNGDDKR